MRSFRAPWCGCTCLVATVLVSGFGCKGSAPTAADVPPRWVELGVPTAGLREIEARSDAHGFFAVYENTTAEALLREVVTALEHRGFTQHGPAPFDDFTRCMQRDTERLVVQAQGLGQLSLFDGEADDNPIFSVCFDPSVTVEETRSPNET